MTIPEEIRKHLPASIAQAVNCMRKDTTQCPLNTATEGKGGEGRAVSKDDCTNTRPFCIIQYKQYKYLECR